MSYVTPDAEHCVFTVLDGTQYKQGSTHQVLPVDGNNSETVSSEHYESTAIIRKSSSTAGNTSA